MPYQSVNPYTEETLESFPEHTEAQLNDMLAAADKTYRNDWRKRSFKERAVVGKAATLLKEKSDELAAYSTREMGKLLHEVKEEVAQSYDFLRYYADNAETMLAPRPLPLDTGEAAVYSAPIGIIFCVEPWNFPYYQLARVAGPNLMAGNTLVEKHAPGVPRCAPPSSKSCWKPARRPARTPTPSCRTNCLRRPSRIGA